YNITQEVVSILVAFDRHDEWLSKTISIRPPSGTMLLYNRKSVHYRKDGYHWKKRKDGKTTREDHMKLKVQGQEFIYGCYVHSAILPTFHRRCYWLLQVSAVMVVACCYCCCIIHHHCYHLQNPNIVLVHYLNLP
ncbi:hypothetical protein HELRODRAFT_145714, partial [Helobdella robusta]|uniref:CG-1 domain-containing protein n=1 Tax=Helobdella robusta TaxID=6412 RepID=T1EJM4_HELRO